ncbi:MAG TPA: DNA methyltransferase [Nevskiaceae bacterium]|nr:DNA methyltransferase [Nevskiaceae bacterium]
MAICGVEKLARGGRKLHPHQKPVALMNWMLDQFGIQPGMTVFDPYMGSASLGVACVRRGVDYVDVEIDPDFFVVARRRLEGEGGVVTVCAADGADNNLSEG